MACRERLYAIFPKSPNRDGLALGLSKFETKPVVPEHPLAGMQIKLVKTCLAHFPEDKEPVLRRHDLAASQRMPIAGIGRKRGIEGLKLD